MSCALQGFGAESTKWTQTPGAPVRSSLCPTARPGDNAFCAPRTVELMKLRSLPADCVLILQKLPR
eukprot:scaffold16784_cov16-Prasinocladus_malaysianus.AAC.1